MEFLPKTPGEWTLVALLFAIGWAFWKHWIVLGPDADADMAKRDEREEELVKERDEWKSLAMSGLSAADRATTVAVATVKRTRRADFEAQDEARS